MLKNQFVSRVVCGFGFGFGLDVKWLAWLSCLLLGVLTAGAVHAGVIDGVVTKVSDGDTIWVQSAAACEPGVPCKPLKVRVHGIDAPERCQAWGPQATLALRERLLNQTVRVSYSRLDVYGRALGRVSLGAEDVGAWMVSQGHAWSYRERRHPGPYAQEQEQATQSKRGLFADPQATEPRVFRKSHGPCKGKDAP